jgi:hypothetical protein
MKKHKMWTKLRVLVNNSENHNTMTATQEGTKAESQYYSATNLVQQRGSSIALNWNQ